MLRTFLSLMLFAGSVSAQGEEEPARQPDPDKMRSVRPLSPAEAMAAIELPAGYHLELVACEPMIKEPAVLAWDGNGRMYVAEMRTYMQDIDGTGAHDPKSRISLLDDTDGDGRMDRHTVFIDGLVLPRMILTLQDSIVVRETDTLDLYEYRDTDGDGRADEKKLVYAGGPRDGNLEHQPSGLDWNVDNFLYVTYTDKRYRYRNGKITADALPDGDGQWGMTHDDWGQCYYSRAGGEVVATNFQQNMQYGRLDLPGQLAPGFDVCWPIDSIPDVQGGPPRIRDDNTLNHFTACCGQVVYRGDRLPAELLGNLFVPEPVGRLVRRAIVTEDHGKRVLTNAHDGAEFLRTKDANFRPINMYTAPDGTLYIVDMYRGIIQDGNWVQRGSYLRGVVQEYGLDRNIGRGRIYRLVHDGYRPGPRPHMLDESTAELVLHLSHPNGWWRDTAQKLIVLRGDVSVAPALRAVMRSDPLAVARMHAMWTLHGLQLLSADDVITLLDDADPRVRAAAVRAGEDFLGEHLHRDVADAILARAADADPRVALQVLRTALYTEVPGYEAAVEVVLAAHREHDAFAKTAKIHFDRIAKAKAEAERLAEIARANAELAAAVERGSKIYRSLCFTCHGENGEGMPVPGVEGMRLAPTLIGSPRVLGATARVGRIVLQGLMGPVDGTTYPGVMAPMAANDDAWVADVLSFVRNSWGNHAGIVTRAEVAAVRSSAAEHAAPWTLEQLRAFDPVLLARERWKLTASRRQEDLHRAIDGDPASRWTTDEVQKPGMWIAIELPETAEVTGIGLDTTPSPNDFPATYEVRVSADGVRWGDPIAAGTGSERDPVIRIPATTTRFLEITQTGGKQQWYWSIHELRLYGEGSPAPK
ncbi:MAG TPA: discoidin domain-containing protein [Planctomycetota bacterium]|nr:discoidin domain-containing protein [Planctomycetota bacterium]